jgi:hypothetical protein
MGYSSGITRPYPYRFTGTSATVNAASTPYFHQAVMIDEKLEEIRCRLADLQTEHRDLDEVIGRMAGDGNVDQLMLQRLKKRKLALKDLIAQLENQLIPDIIA